MAQEELDRVLPPGQLPDFTYESSLPYITAIVKEVLRWHPVTPVGQFQTILVNESRSSSTLRLPRATPSSSDR